MVIEYKEKLDKSKKFLSSNIKEIIILNIFLKIKGQVRN